MLRDWLLFLHIVSVVVYLGGAVAITVQSTAAAGIPRQFLSLADRAGRAVGIGAGLTLLTGIALVVESDFWGFSMFFVWFGIAALVISGAVDSVFTRRQTAAIEAAIEDDGPDSPKVIAGFQRVARVNAVVIVLLVFVVWTMVFKAGI